MNHSTKMYFSNQRILKLLAIQQLCACGATRSTSSLPSTSSKKQNLTSTKQENDQIALGSAKKELVNSVTYGRVPGTRRKTEITRVDPAEWEHLPIGQQKIPFLQRRGESQSVWSHLAPDRRHNHIDRMAFLQADIDLRPVAFKRVWRSIEAEHEIKQQEYKSERNKVLGNELAAAHFIVFRKGKVKFLHQSEWVTKYRVDQSTEEDERDLIPLSQKTKNLCTLPTLYDPMYRLEAIDASGVPLLFNGLANFEGLNHLTWLSFRKADNRFNDWCLDRVYNLFHHTLEYLDLSECTGISERGIAAAWKLKNLRTLVVENLPHIKNLEVVCSLLEEQLPGLTCIGVDYEKKALELKKENEEAERLEQERLAELEASTINITPRLESDEPNEPEMLNTRKPNERRKIGSKV